MILCVKRHRQAHPPFRASCSERLPHRTYACTWPAPAVTAQAKIYFNLISSAEGGDPSLASCHCYSDTDGCHGENLGTGKDDAVAALIANCVPRHQ